MNWSCLFFMTTFLLLLSPPIHTHLRDSHFSLCFVLVMALSREKAFVIPAQGQLFVSTYNSPTPARVVVVSDPLEGSRRVAPKADILGTELPAGVPVTISTNRSVSVYSYNGCTVSVQASTAILQRCYVTGSSQCHMRSVLDLHLHLENLRGEAEAHERSGPRILFVSDRRYAGVSTYVHYLAQFCCREGHQPLILDGSCTSPHFGYPNCVSLYSLQYPIDPEEGTNLTPGIHFYAGREQGRNPTLYGNCVASALAAANERMANFPQCRTGGLFLDYGVVGPDEILAAEAESTSTAATSGAHDSQQRTNPLDLLIDTIVDAEVDHVCVVESAWLRYKIVQRIHERRTRQAAVSMSAAVAETQLETGGILKTFLLDGCGFAPVAADSVVRRQKWMQYFFGTKTSPLKPTLVKVSLDGLQVAVLGERDHGRMKTLMPMMDETEEASASADRETIAVKFLSPQEGGVQGKVAAISSATEYKISAEGGALVRLSLTEFENAIRCSYVVGFALVQLVTEKDVTLIVSDASLVKKKGLCLLLTNEVLQTSSS